MKLIPTPCNHCNDCPSDRSRPARSGSRERRPARKGRTGQRARHGLRRARRSRFADAQDAIERSAFDIVLLGLELPDSPVNDTLRRIASLPVAVPVIVLTPHPDDETTTTAVREGAEDYFVKSELNGVWLARAIRNAIERHRIRAAWRMSEERLARIIDSAMDGIITADEGLRIVIFNPAAERMFECSASDAIGQRLDRFIPDPEHAPASFRARRAGGDEFPAEASISQTTVAGRRLFTVILRDVTKRLQTEETLHQSEERLQTALEVGRMGTWTFDFDTKEVWADDKMLKLVGRSRADWPKGPQGAAGLVHPEDRAAVWEGLRIDPSDPGPAMRSVEMRIVLPDGSPRWLAVTGRLERDHNGHRPDRRDCQRRVGAEAVRRRAAAIAEARSSGNLGGWRGARFQQYPARDHG